MAIIKIKQLLVLGLAASIMVGCASKPTAEAPAASPQAEAPQSAPDASDSKSSLSVRDGALYELNANGDYVPVGNGKFYFDYDQSLIKPEAIADLNKHAKYLAENSGTSVRLEGHADERGTREYNLALGERRANAVLGYLTSQGAAGNQAEVISYGEEKPVVDGHDESAWVQNRRVELIYK